ncbi:MAG TPA: tripartite tricarboxylate transporter TctB family protein, partial [Thermodesulfobacteriota bacterium]|nr:tripartite tricarboxylate transporter TctB family protein [Thermodesulfobacteriota bacterium]
MLRNPKDLGSGLMFLVVGCLCVAIARAYPMGATAQMGPGYFPTILGSLLALNGGALVVRSFFRNGSGLSSVSWRGILLSVAALVLFGLLLKTAGLGIAVLVLVMVGATASAEFRVWSSLLLAVGLSIFCGFVF